MESGPRRPGDHAPGAPGEAAAALSQSGEPWSTGGSEAGVRGEAGFCLPSAVRSHSHYSTRMLPLFPLPLFPFPLVPQICAQGPEGTPGMARVEVGRRGAAGMVWKSRALPCHPPRPAVSDPLCQGMGSKGPP